VEDSPWVKRSKPRSAVALARGVPKIPRTDFPPT